MSLNFERKLVLISLALFSAVMVVLAFVANGTGDEGDSILHFLFSRFAFEHPENFLNHWAKPLFVLLTAPIAQGGFIAMKIFNIALLIGTLWMTWRVAQIMEVRNAWAVIFPVIFSIMTISHTLSGLTEPMFAFWMMAGIFLFVKEKPISAVLWMSFLPFVRSEGLIIFCVLVIYLLLKKHWKLLPLLAFGHVFYSFVGYFHYNDLLWVFNKMTYATPVSAYGSGPLFHFADNMSMVMGDLLPALLVLGVLVGGLRIIQFWQGKKSFSKDELWLVYGIAIAYFIAHSLFWYLGIFNSFGLMRVMIGVLPVFAIIIIQGINFLLELLPENYAFAKNRILYGVVFLMGLFLFFRLSYNNHLMLNDAQMCQTTLAEKYSEKYKNYTHFFDAIHPALAFDVDWFQPSEHRMTGQLFSGEPIPEKSIAVWDSWFSKSEAKIPLEQMRSDTRLKEIECVIINGKTSCLFEFDPAFAEKKVMLETSFENEKSFDLIDSTYFRTGRFSKVVGKKKPFSSSFQGWISGFSDKKNPKIKFSFWAFIPADFEGKHPAQAVISFESAAKSFDYTGVNIFEKGDEKGVWKYFEIEKPILDYKTYRDKVKAYIWNPAKVNVFVDDMKIEWSEDE